MLFFSFLLKMLHKFPWALGLGTFSLFTFCLVLTLQHQLLACLRGILVHSIENVWFFNSSRVAQVDWLLLRNLVFHRHSPNWPEIANFVKKFPNRPRRVESERVGFLVVNILNLKFGVPNWFSWTTCLGQLCVCSRPMSHRGTSSFNFHRGHDIVVIGNIQLGFMKDVFKRTKSTLSTVQPSVIENVGSWFWNQELLQYPCGVYGWVGYCHRMIANPNCYVQRIKSKNPIHTLSSIPEKELLIL